MDLVDGGDDCIAACQVLAIARIPCSQPGQVSAVRMKAAALNTADSRRLAVRNLTGRYHLDY